MLLAMMPSWLHLLISVSDGSRDCEGGRSGDSGEVGRSGDCGSADGEGERSGDCSSVGDDCGESFRGFG
jgi:hypothetical protein